MRCIATSLLAALCLSLAAADALSADNEFKPLFDGKTLNGWEGDTKVFRVDNGAIVGGSLDKPVAHNDFLCTTADYGDFELRLKFKLEGQGANAGVQFRSRRIPNHFEVKGYQADLGDRYWGALYDESRRNKILLATKPEDVAKFLKPGDWNDYRIRCQGKHIQLWINGQQTVDYTEPDDSIEQTGIIGLQIHGGGPSQASYKDIEIKKL